MNTRLVTKRKNSAIIDNFIKNHVLKNFDLNEESIKTIKHNLNIMPQGEAENCRIAFKNLIKLEDRSKALDFINLLTVNEENQVKMRKELKSKIRAESGVFMYPLRLISNKAKSILSNTAFNYGAAASTHMLGVYASTATLSIGASFNAGLVITSGIIAGATQLGLRTISNNYGISNEDLKSIHSKIKADNPKANEELSKIFQSSSAIPQNIKDSNLKVQKEYLNDVIDVFKHSQRYNKTLLRNADFNVIIKIIEKTVEEGKKEVPDFNIRNLTNHKREKGIFANKNLDAVLNHNTLMYLKENGAAVNKLTEGVKKIDDKDVKVLSKMLSKNFDLLRRNIVAVADIYQVNDYVNDATTAISKDLGENISREEVREAFKIFVQEANNFLDYKEVIGEKVNDVFTESLYEENGIKNLNFDNFEPSEETKMFLKNTNLEEAYYGIQKWVKNGVNDKEFIEQTDEAFKRADLLDSETITSAKIDKIVESMTELDEENKKTSEKLIDEGSGTSTVGRFFINSFELMEKVTDKMTHLFSGVKKVPFAKSMLHMAKKLSIMLLVGMEKTVSFVPKLMADIIPTNVSLAISFAFNDKKTIKESGLNIEFDKKNVSFNSMLSRSIKKDNKDNDNLGYYYKKLST